MAACVAMIYLDLEIFNGAWGCSGAASGACWRVSFLLRAKFLAFCCGRSWSMSVVLVSSGKARICTDLKS